MWKIRCLLVVVLATSALALASPAIASTTASFTVTARGDVGLPQPPTNFTVTRITDTLVQVSWTPWIGSANTSIRVKYDSEPTSKDDGYLLYYGAGDNVTDVYLNLDVMWSKMWYTAASENYTGGWSDYISEYAESPNVAEIAAELGNLSDSMGGIGNINQIMTALVCLLPLVMFSVLAFWKESKELFMITFGIATITGFSAPNIISGAYETTSLGMAFGILLIGYAMFCAGMAFRLMFWKGEATE